MSMERWWNGTDGGNEYGALVEWYRRGETEVLVENPVRVPLCPSHISLDCLGFEPGRSERSATDRPNHTAAF